MKNTIDFRLIALNNAITEMRDKLQYWLDTENEAKVAIENLRRDIKEMQAAYDERKNKGS